MPQLGDLQALLAIAQEGTVTRAAERLGATQPALSYTLERMRQRFGDPLFVRIGNRMEPTPFAQRLCEPAARVLRILETEIGGLKNFIPSETTREFRLGVNEIGAITIVPKLVRHLAQVAPHARLASIQVNRITLAPMLESGEIDLGAGHFPELDVTLVQQLLFNRSYVCVARADHPHVGEALTLEQFATTPRIQTLVMPAVANWLAHALRKQPTAATVHFTSQHFAAIPFIVAESDLIAIIPEEVYLLFHATAGIKRVHLPMPLPTIGIHQYWHSRTAVDPAVLFLREAVLCSVQGRCFSSRTSLP